MSGGATRPISSRPLATEDDWWRIRELLVTTYPITPIYFNWDIRRWDGWRFHREVPRTVDQMRETVRLWETPEGQISGSCSPRG